MFIQSGFGSGLCVILLWQIPRFTPVPAEGYEVWDCVIAAVVFIISVTVRKLPIGDEPVVIN